jgi:polyhydroxyalkanoate synthase
VVPHAIGTLATAVSATAGGLGGLPVDLIQAFFAGIDPLGVPRKFARFASLDPCSAAAETFVAVEDWLNDGVPLGPEVARECLHDWYGANRPMLGDWQIGKRWIRPETLTLPCLVAVPEQDRIVPERSALALADQLPAATIIRPASGHVGMVVGSRAPRELWEPLETWLWRIAALQK